MKINNQSILNEINLLKKLRTELIRLNTLKLKNIETSRLRMNINKIENSLYIEILKLRNNLQNDVKCIDEQIELFNKFNKNINPSLQIKYSDYINKSKSVIIYSQGLIFIKNDICKLFYKLKYIGFKYFSKFNFENVICPEIMNSESFYNGGFLPKFNDNMFNIDNDSYIIPTSEVALLSLSSQTFNGNKKTRYMSFTSCYRNEKTDIKLMIRLKHFHKIELFSTVSTYEESLIEHNELVNIVKNFIKTLKLNYRVILLSKENTGFSSSKTYDIEVYLPISNIWIEVASISNCTNFQALRSQKNNMFTLNATGLAFERIIIAFIEYGYVEKHI